VLIGAILIGAALVFICGLVALEVALLESKRAFVPQSDSQIDGSSSTRSNVEADEAVSVADYIAAARLCIAALLLVIGAVSVLSFFNYQKPIDGSLAGVIVRALAVVGLISAVVALGFVLPNYLGTRFREIIIKIISPIGCSVVGLVWPVVAMTRIVRRLGGEREGKVSVEEEAIEEDIRSLVEEGERAGVIEEEEREMISRVFRLGDKPIVSIMTSRGDVVFLDVGMTIGQAVAVALDSRLSWFPVRQGFDEEVIGIVSVHDVFEQRRGASDEAVAMLKEVSSPAMDVPESMTALELLERFKEHGKRFAIVRDEYGGVSGIVTVDDVLQVVVGDMGDLNGEEKSVTTREDGSLLVDASLDVHNLFETLDCSGTSEDEQGQFHSVGGFVMAALGRIPKAGDYFTHDRYRFEVVDMDGKRIDKVLISRVSDQKAVGS
jgi:putative hemolysin